MIVVVTHLFHFVSKLLWLPGDFFGLKGFLQQRKRLFQYLMRKIESHRANFDKSNIRDYIDAFLLEMDSCKQSSPGSTSFTGYFLLDVTVYLGEFTSRILNKWNILTLHNLMFPIIVEEQLLFTVVDMFSGMRLLQQM